MSANILRDSAAVLAIAAAVIAISTHEPGEMTPQARGCLRFAEAPTLGEALSMHPLTRPPLYGIVLRTYTKLGLPAQSLNPLIFGGLLIWMWMLTRRVAPQVWPVIPVFSLALAHFNYPVMSTYVSETLFTFLSAMVFSALLGYVREPTRGKHLWLACLTGIACATRFMGLFWLLPIVVLRVLLASGHSLRRRIANAAGLSLIAIAPASLWMARAYSMTGYISGRNRDSFREGGDRVDLAGWDKASEIFSQWAKTLFLDFTSTTTEATHPAVNNPYAANPIEITVAILAVVAIATAAIALRAPASRAARQLFAGDFTAISRTSEYHLLLQFVLWFMLATLAIWIGGNNDNLYSRFLYPCYPFAVLLGFATYWRVQKMDLGILWRLPFHAAYFGILAVQLLRSFAFLRPG